MDALRLYIDDSDNLWLFFADSSSHIGGPFLYCLDSKTLKLKKNVRLYSDKGTPSTSPYEPLFVSHDQNGNFILATNQAYLTKVDQQGKPLYRKRLMEYVLTWINSGEKRKRPYFVRDMRKYGDDDEKRKSSGKWHGNSTSSLLMMSAAYSRSCDLLFVGQGCQCCSNDVLVYNGDGKYLYHIASPVGPEAIVARNGLLYLGDSFNSLVHVCTYDGQWLRSLDILFRDCFEGIHYGEDGQAYHKWKNDKQPEFDKDNHIASICSMGVDKLAVGLHKGLIRVLNKDGKLLYDIEPPRSGLYPNSMAADSSENLFVYYTTSQWFEKPIGLYCYGVDRKVKGPLLKGKLGVLTPVEKNLGMKIAEDRADAYDYFQLADIHIYRKKLSQETIRLLEKSLKLKPNLWIAQAYLGLSFLELGEKERAIQCMETAMEHMNCSVMATALIEYYYRQGDREKVWQYFQMMEATDDDFDIESYSYELTKDQIEQLLGPLVKRNKSDNLVSNRP